MDRQQSESVPSAAHLSWLCLVEYLKLVKNKEELPPDIDVTTKEIEFDLLLDRTFAGFENADVRESLSTLGAPLSYSHIFTGCKIRNKGVL